MDVKDEFDKSRRYSFEERGGFENLLSSPQWQHPEFREAVTCRLVGTTALYDAVKVVAHEGVVLPVTHERGMDDKPTEAESAVVLSKSLDAYRGEVTALLGRSVIKLPLSEDGTPLFTITPLPEDESHTETINYIQ